MSASRTFWLAFPLLWVCLSACPRSTPMPRVVAPPVKQVRDAELALPESHLSVRLQTDLTAFEGMLAESLNQRLNLKQDDWTRVTAEGATPEVETRMQASIETPRLRMEKGALAVSVPIAYWGKVRAQAKTPFGKFWLTRGLDWGTAKAPGRITLLLRVLPTLDERFHLSTQTSLDDVEFTAPPGDALCGRLVIEVCVPRETAAKQVHNELEKQIRAHARGLLSTLDQRVAREAKIGRLIDAGLSTLRSEVALADGRFLAIEPRALTHGAFEGAGERVAFPLTLVFVPQFRGQSAGAVPERDLEQRRPPRGADAIHLDVEVPYMAWGDKLTRQLGTVRAGDFSVSKAQVLGAASERERAVVLALTLVRDVEELTVYATALPSVEGSTLSLKESEWTVSSREALAGLELDASRLLGDVSAVSNLAVDALLSERVEQVSARFRVPFALFGNFSLSTRKPSFEAPRFTPESVLIRARTNIQAKL